MANNRPDSALTRRFAKMGREDRAEVILKMTGYDPMERDEKRGVSASFLQEWKRALAVCEYAKSGGCQ